MKKTLAFLAITFITLNSFSQPPLGANGTTINPPVITAGASSTTSRIETVLINQPGNSTYADLIINTPYKYFYNPPTFVKECPADKCYKLLIRNALTVDMNDKMVVTDSLAAINALLYMLQYYRK